MKKTTLLGGSRLQKSNSRISLANWKGVWIIQHTWEALRSNSKIQGWKFEGEIIVAAMPPGCKLQCWWHGSKRFSVYRTDYKKILSIFPLCRQDCSSKTIFTVSANGNSQIEWINSFFIVLQLLRNYAAKVCTERVFRMLINLGHINYIMRESYCSSLSPA
jgi:hypothetical protein